VKATINVCDLCDEQTEADVTVRLTTEEGVTYTVDLCADHDDEYLRPLVIHGQVLRGDHPRGFTKRRLNGSDPAPSVVRAWALDNGYDVAAKGIIPAAIWEAYGEANR
jgi:hypothetical protein